MERQQIDSIGVGLGSGAGGKRRSAEEIIDLESHRVSGAGLNQHPQTLHRYGIALRHRSLGPQTLHQGPTPESLDYFLERGCNDAHSYLRGVALQAIAVAPERERSGDITEQSFLVAIPAVVINRQGEAQLVEHIDG